MTMAHGGVFLKNRIIDLIAVDLYFLGLGFIYLIADSKFRIKKTVLYIVSTTRKAIVLVGGKIPTADACIARWFFGTGNK